MISLLRRLLVSPSKNLDLVGVWLVTVVLHTLVPSGHELGRADLVPWITLCMTAVAFLRARPLGDTPHPSLAPRHGTAARWSHRLGLTLTPGLMMLAFDGAAALAQGTWRDQLPRLYLAAGLSLLVPGLLAFGRADGRTAWNPRGYRSWAVWILRATLLGGLTLSLGVIHGASQEPIGWWTSASGLLGTMFLALGMLPDRIQSLRQRRAAGRRDGRPYRSGIFRFLLAPLGPSIGMALLVGLHALLDMPVTFTQSTVISLHIFAWAAVVWPPEVPIAVSCLLHEVVPAGGKDPAISGGAAGFDRPPKGALQLDPLGVKRLRVLHHWLVPVRDPRIEEFDDPVRLLWPRPGLSLPYHVLGEASFEPDATTQLPQWHTITIRLDEQRDVGRLEQGNVQTRRLSVLRAFPSRGAAPERSLRTYRWEDDIPAGKMQVVDATTERITLQDGDILVLSTEGVARAFELEIGAPVFATTDAGSHRVPQLEDYVGVS